MAKKGSKPELDLMSNLLLNRYKDLDFVKRIQDSTIADPIKNIDGSVSSHKMRAEVDKNGNWYVFPEIVNINGKLKNLGDRAFDYALEKKEYIPVKNKELALYFAENGYKRTSFAGDTFKNKGGTAMSKNKFSIEDVAQLMNKTVKKDSQLMNKTVKLSDSGGVIEGPGTGKSDSIKAKFDNGDFIIPANANKKVTKDILKKFGLDKKAPLKSGTENVNVSDGEAIIPAEIKGDVNEYIQSKYGITLKDMAPKGTPGGKNKVTGDEVGNVAQSTATGASTGTAFGPWGAAIGGLAGLGLGIYQALGAEDKLSELGDTNEIQPEYDKIIKRLSSDEDLAKVRTSEMEQQARTGIDAGAKTAIERSIEANKLNAVATAGNISPQLRRATAIAAGQSATSARGDLALKDEMAKLRKMSFVETALGREVAAGSALNRGLLARAIEQTRKNERYEDRLLSTGDAGVNNILGSLQTLGTAYDLYSSNKKKPKSASDVQKAITQYGADAKPHSGQDYNYDYDKMFEHLSPDFWNYVNE